MAENTVGTNEKWPPLEKTCPACGGVPAAYDCYTCHACGGRGVVPTEFGSAFIGFVERWVNPKNLSED